MKDSIASEPSAPAPGPSGFDFQTEHRPPPSRQSHLRNVVEWILVLVGAVVVALLIKTFLFQAFYIPSRSMEPTLEVGDRVLVNKLVYDLRDVQRGDIVVFERPEEEHADGIRDLIKRVVALPGESVVIRDDAVHVDGRRVLEPYLAPGEPVSNAMGAPFQCTDEQPCVVPEGSVWVMGDNRTDSRDSRYFGPIEEADIVGRAFVLIWPLDRFTFFAFPIGPWLLGAVGGAVVVFLAVGLLRRQPSPRR